MIQIYELSKAHGVLLCNEQNQLFMQRIAENRIGKAEIVAEDYRTGLSGIVFQGEVWCAYENRRNQIVLVKIAVEGESVIQFMMDMEPVSADRMDENRIDEERSDVSSSGSIANLILWQEDLMLFFEGKCIFPLHREKDVDLGKMRLCYVGRDSLICRDCENERRLWLMDSAMQMQSLDLADNWMAKLENMEKQLDQKQEEIMDLRSSIESAVRQYQELMGVAEQYRDEAIKWRSKFVF